MKKLIKRKLFYQNGCSKNYLLWENINDKGISYELVEEFKGHSISRAKLRGVYNNRFAAFLGFKKTVELETAAASRVPFGSRLVLG